MTSTCNQCKFLFKETSVQIFKRIKEKTKPICRDCSRLNKAEEAAKKRIEQKNIPTNNSRDNLILQYKKKHGLISVPFIMRKFKMSHEAATELKVSLDLCENAV